MAGLAVGAGADLPVADSLAAGVAPFFPVTEGWVFGMVTPLSAAEDRVDGAGEDLPVAAGSAEGMSTPVLPGVIAGGVEVAPGVLMTVPVLPEVAPGDAEVPSGVVTGIKVLPSEADGSIRAGCSVGITVPAAGVVAAGSSGAT